MPKDRLRHDPLDVLTGAGVECGQIQMVPRDNRFRATIGGTVMRFMCPPCPSATTA